MVKQGICEVAPRAFFLLGFLSLAFGNQNLDYPDYQSTLRSFQESCRDYPDSSPCSYWNSENDSFQTENEDVRTKRDLFQSNDTRRFNVTDSENLEKREAPNDPIDYDSLNRIDSYYYNDRDGDQNSQTENSLEKRYSIYKIRNPETEGYKRGPGFRSWGGKRAPEDENSEKRAKFVSWGGKRSKFSNWGGKRSYEDEKRAEFASRGGKRSDESDDFEKRAKFGSWGGKRFDDFRDEKRAKFVSWGGKRSFWDEPDEKRAKFGSWGGKRAKFVSWGGKRSSWDEPDEKRAKFGSWGGKRDAEYPMSYDQRLDLELVQDPNDLITKRGAFQSWGGKRSITRNSPYWYLNGNDIRKYLNWGGKRKFSSWGGKRSFSSWGGKRSSLQNNYNRTQDLEDNNNNQLKINKRSYSFAKNEDFYSQDSDSGAKRRSEFFPWGGKRNQR